MDLTTYFWQANLVWLLLYAVYWLFLRRETFFHWNRFYLLGASFFALIFPFLPIPMLFQEAVPEDQVLLFFGGEEVEVAVNQVATLEISSLITWENALLIVYFLGFTFLAIRLFISLFKIGKLIFSQKKQKTSKGYYVVKTSAETPIFSFLNILFWNENTNISKKEKAKILAHELVHIRQWHSLDVLFMELMTIVFWCNPVAWAYKKSLQTIHEYLADAGALEQETSKTDYANLLVSQLLHTNTFLITTPFFNKSLLKNRIMMIYQKKSNQKALAKFAFIFPIVAICLLIAACSKELNTIQLAQFNFVQGFDFKEKYVTKDNKSIVLDFEGETSYMFRLANHSGNFEGIIVELYTPKNELVATNYVNQRYFNGFTYRCKETGKYRLLTKVSKDSEQGTLVGIAERGVVSPPKDNANTTFANIKEYDAPAGKTSEFAMVLSKGTTYTFRMTKSTAEIKVTSEDGKENFSTDDGKLILKNIEKTGIYKLYITPKGQEDAKVNLSFARE